MGAATYVCDVVNVCERGHLDDEVEDGVGGEAKLCQCRGLGGRGNDNNLAAGLGRCALAQRHEDLQHGVRKVWADAHKACKEGGKGQRSVSIDDQVPSQVLRE